MSQHDQPSATDGETSVQKVIATMAANRCYACGWPLGSCQPFNCAMRFKDENANIAEREKWHARATEMNEVLGTLLKAPVSETVSKFGDCARFGLCKTPLLCGESEQCLDQATRSATRELYPAMAKPDDKWSHSNGPSSTVKDLRALSNVLVGSDDRELLQHAADMIEVLSKATPSATLSPLEKLALDMIAAFREIGIGDIDGGWFQDTAEKHGVLVPTEAREPCGETCGCAELADFPQICYRDSDEVHQKRLLYVHSSPQEKP